MEHSKNNPVSTVTTISSEEELVKIFGKPNSSNFETFFCAANFLGYTNALKVVRAESGLLNAGANSGILIRDTEHYLTSFSTGQGSHGEWTARTAGTWGNNLGVSICPSATVYEQNLGSSNQTVGEDVLRSTVIKVDDGTAFNVGDMISFSTVDASTTASNFAHISGDEGNEYEITAISTHDLTIRLKDDPNESGVKVIVPDNTFIRRRWRFYDFFNGAPGTSPFCTENAKGTNDELHVVVFDEDGGITGTAISGGNRSRAVA